MKIKKHLFLLASLIMALSMILSACGGGSAATEAPAATSAPASGSEPVTIRYVMWDSNQLAPYQACADAFHQKFPRSEERRVGKECRL